jgi:peptidoglycan hydrolase CwlO-like protein
MIFSACSQISDQAGEIGTELKNTKENIEQEIDAANRQIKETSEKIDSATTKIQETKETLSNIKLQ